MPLVYPGYNYIACDVSKSFSVSIKRCMAFIFSGFARRSF